MILKALSDETRMKIVVLLLKNNCCVRALAGKLQISEAAVSQHLKVLREAGLLTGEKKGYFMHYKVNQNALHQLAAEIDALANMRREETHKKEFCWKKTKNCRGHDSGHGFCGCY